MKLIIFGIGKRGKVHYVTGLRVERVNCLEHKDHSNLGMGNV